MAKMATPKLARRLGGPKLARRLGGPQQIPIADETACCVPSLLEAPLSEVDAHELARAFAALSDPVRLRCLSLIASADECCSCDLEAPLGRSQPTISHHTKVLAEAGLIVGEKRGRWMWWKAVPDRLAAVSGALGSSGAR